MSAEFRNFTIEMNMEGNVRRWWNGSRTLTLNGLDYEGTAVRNADGTESAAIGLEAAETIAGEVGRRCRIRIAVTDETVRRQVSVDLGPIEVKIQWIYRLADATSWGVADEFTGTLSGPSLDVGTGVYSADVDGEFGRFGKGRVKKWSDQQQQAEYPGDKCFENLDAIRRGQVRIRW